MKKKWKCCVTIEVNQKVSHFPTETDAMEVGLEPICLNNSPLVSEIVRILQNRLSYKYNFQIKFLVLDQGGLTLYATRLCTH